jgi:hypothetical protein
MKYTIIIEKGCESGHVAYAPALIAFLRAQSKVKRLR